MTDVNFPQDFYLDDVGVWRLNKEKLAELNKPKPMTNEEWFCNLSTEEKAEWLSKHFHCGDCIFEEPMCGGEYDGCKSAFVEWLKEKHDGNMGRNP